LGLNDQVDSPPVAVGPFKICQGHFRSYRRNHRIRQVVEPRSASRLVPDGPWLGTDRNDGSLKIACQLRVSCRSGLPAPQQVGQGTQPCRLLKHVGCGKKTFSGSSVQSSDRLFERTLELPFDTMRWKNGTVRQPRLIDAKVESSHGPLDAILCSRAAAACSQSDWFMASTLVRPP
jgi:hypothetical protein